MLPAASALLNWGPPGCTLYVLQLQLSCRAWLVCCTSGVRLQWITAALLLHSLLSCCAQLPQWYACSAAAHAMLPVHRLQVTNEKVVFWAPSNKTVAGRQRQCIGAITLSETPLTLSDQDAVPALIQVRQQSPHQCALWGGDSVNISCVVAPTNMLLMKRCVWFTITLQGRAAQASMHSTVNMQRLHTGAHTGQGSRALQGCRSKDCRLQSCQHFDLCWARVPVPSPGLLLTQLGVVCCCSRPASRLLRATLV